MEYTRKRLLGYVSLAAVLATTAFATTLPGSEASATGSAGATVTYVVNVINPLRVEIDGGDGEKNPTVTVTPDPDAEDDEDESKKVVEIEYTITDEEGNPVIGPETWPVPEGGGTFELPFDDLGLPSGEYTITIVGKNAQGEEVATYTYTFSYTAPIYVPDTGMLTLGDLQIAHADYWALGIICALLAGGVGFALYRRARKQEKSH